MAVGSKVACVAFAGDHIQDSDEYGDRGKWTGGKRGGSTFTYENAGSGYYADIVFDWKTVTDTSDEGKTALTNDLTSELNRVTQGPSTHTAAGFYEAKLLLSENTVLKDTNEKS